MWVPISSTNTNRSGSMRPTSMRHKSLKNSSLSAAHLDLFFRLLRRRPTARQTVASLTITPDAANRNSALWEWVAHGLSSRSSKSNFVAFSSSFEALPGAFLGSSVPRSSSCLQ